MSISASDISLPTTGATVSGATLVAPSGSGSTAVGEYCKVTGAISPVDKTAPPIRFDVALPSTWNGKAMHLMGGGYDGSVVTGSSSPPGTSGLPSPVARGYAAFGSDSGHSGSAGEASFALNNEALENYLGDQLRKTRDVAIKLIVKRYGASPKRTYSAGGSGGGREALYVADRWPTLYDGVIAYYPAWSLTAMLSSYALISKSLAAPGAWSNANKQSLLATSVTAACDSLDGVADGVVSNVKACAFDPAMIACPGGADTGDTCLSDAQITGFKAYATPLNFPYALANGTNVYPPYNIFNGGLTPAMGTAAPATPSSFSMPFATYIGESFVKYWVYQDPSFDPFQFSLNANGYVQQRLQYISSRQDINPNLTPFASKGGKVIIVHGMADPLIPASSSEQFYTRAVGAMGAQMVGSSMKFYEVPGFGHGGGGPFTVRFDSISALEQWVENGTAPLNQIATDTNAATFGRTRPMCEYPTWPKYNGTGDLNVAASYSCVN
jgi:feruloyl esterase